MKLNKFYILKKTVEIEGFPFDKGEIIQIISLDSKEFEIKIIYSTEDDQGCIYIIRNKKRLIESVKQIPKSTVVAYSI